jgi:hypothetical protein
MTDVGNVVLSFLKIIITINAVRRFGAPDIDRG